MLKIHHTLYFFFFFFLKQCFFVHLIYRVRFTFLKFGMRVNNVECIFIAVNYIFYAPTIIYLIKKKPLSRDNRTWPTGLNTMFSQWQYILYYYNLLNSFNGS